MFCASQESRNCGSSLWLRCVGAWRRNIFGAYKLNHFALRWGPTGQRLVGLANIREEVTASKVTRGALRWINPIRTETFWSTSPAMSARSASRPTSRSQSGSRVLGSGGLGSKSTRIDEQNPSTRLSAARVLAVRGRLGLQCRQSHFSPRCHALEPTQPGTRRAILSELALRCIHHSGI